MTGSWDVTTEFHTFPVEEAMTWIRAWTDHTWPMTLQDALSVCDSLGWTPSPKDAHFFITKLSMNGQEDGLILQSNQFGIKGVSFNLSSFPRVGKDDRNIANAATSYSQCIGSLEQSWGRGKLTTDTDGASLCRWTLHNGVSISISRVNALIGVNIDSPWRTQLKEEYNRVMEDYE
ncbi:DUF6301 family protein [Actinomyces bowdenii]|uniref:DUF6301 family protein n=1 Tax=Actinomyces bowdenii TaxID=131109 RepID=UPI003C7C7160